MRILISITVLFLIVTFVSCDQDSKIVNENLESVTTRIKRDPNFLFPSKSMAITETQINQYLYLPLANYDPEKLELIPILIEEIPQGKIITQGPFKGTIRFDCRFRDEAEWEKGKPITAKDYLFSIKTYKLDGIKINPAVKSIFKELIDVEPDPNDEKKFSIYVNEEYFLAKELAIVTEIIPEYIYDSSFVFRNLKLDNGEITFEENNSPDLEKQVEQQIEFLNHADCGRKIIVGSGPYELLDWQSNQQIILQKKKDYWGATYKDNPYLVANPEMIIFSVIADDNAAITSMKNGTLDVMRNVRGSDFIQIKNDEKLGMKFDYYNPSQLKYYFIGMNNHSELLSDKSIRLAVSHLVDVDEFIKNNELGLGIRLASVILPNRNYYNDTLPLIKYDPDFAKDLLEKGGWTDSNGDGFVDKIVDGKLKNLSLDILITGSRLGKNLALTLKERAILAGVDINIITKESKLISKEIRERNFDLRPHGKNYGIYPEDLYQSWHSNNNYPGGSNIYGFDNPEADKIIDEIRSSDNQIEREELYKKVQEIIYHEHSRIFLYAPTNNMIVNNQLKAYTTVLKTGYFLNLFKTKDEEKDL